MADDSQYFRGKEPAKVAEMIQRREAIMAIACFTSFITSTALADATSVLTVNSLRIPGQPVVLQEEAGDCLFFGDLAHSGNVHIQIKVCKKDDGSLLATYYPAIAEVDLLPVLEGIRLYLRTTPRN